ncbi:hypothetical protein [Komagataeibacter swingsii]|uniref:hypothetical protein n=1 Tax=Komagataeibacter swingsii TaxID=215220 RepID=UPI001C3FFEE4|nr:hypothetical protein [Komagataeibacter swingsii]
MNKTEIGGTDSFSGRTYDERYLTRFINEHWLPVNPTTAFLTPTLRNIGQPLTTDRELVGRPPKVASKPATGIVMHFCGITTRDDRLVFSSPRTLFRAQPS